MTKETEVQHSVSVALDWVAAANAHDGDRLDALSGMDIEIVGPRGVAQGVDVLREWLARAGLTLETARIFARGPDVVLAGRGTWRTPGASITSSADVASWFTIREGRVARYQRFDNLQAALESAGLEPIHEAERPDT